MRSTVARWNSASSSLRIGFLLENRAVRRFEALPELDEGTVDRRLCAEGAEERVDLLDAPRVLSARFQDRLDGDTGGEPRHPVTSSASAFLGGHASGGSPPDSPQH